MFISFPATTQQTGPHAVTITWTHDHGLDGLTRQVLRNGETITDVGYTVELQEDGRQLMARSQVQVWADSNTLIQARICSINQVCTTESASRAGVVTTPTVPRANPEISLAPYHGGYQDPTRYGSTLSYTTPAYFSLDQPRTLTLLYVSETAFPRGFVQLDVTDRSTQRPEVLSLAVTDSAGAARQLTNGGYIAYWRNVGDTTKRVSRLAAQWSTLNAPTGAPKYRLTVRSYWKEADGSTTFKETVDSIRVPMVNRSASPYGPGWMIAGIQRLHPTASGVLVDEGTGAASWFEGPASALTAPEGDRSTLVYDAAAATYRRTWPDSSGVLFTALGHPVYRYNQMGDTTRYTFSGDRLTAVTDPAGKSFRLTYDSAGMLRYITDPHGRYATITMVNGMIYYIVDYDDSTVLGNMAYEVTTTGATTRRLSGWSDRGGGHYNITYDKFGTPISTLLPQVTLASGATVRTQTTATSEKTRLLNGGGLYPSATQAPRRFAEDAYAAYTDARGFTTTVNHDRFGQPLYITGPLGHGTDIKRDSLGDPISITQGGQTVHMAWTPEGELARSFDERTGIQNDYDYDYDGSGGTFLSRSSQGSSDVHYERGTRGEVLAVRIGTDTVPVARYTYDSRLRVRTATDTGGHVTEYFYDGNPSLNVDSVRVVTPQGTTRTSFTYDAVGRPVAVTDPSGTVATTGYDNLNRVVRVHVPGDSVRTQYFADSTVVTDAVGKRYQAAVNRQGWTISERDPQGRTTLAAYDAAGNAVRRTDRFGRVFVSDFDAMGRLTRLAAPDDTIRYAYDNPGSNWVAVSNAESTDTIFREIGNGSSTLSVMGGERYRVRTTYDRNGRHSGTRVWRGNDFTPAWSDFTTFQYNPRGALSVVADVAGAYASLLYNAEDQLKQITYPAPLDTVTLGYNSRHKLNETQYSVTALNNAFGTEFIGSDVLGRVTLMEGPSRRRRYEYDALGRVSALRDTSKVVIPPPPGCTRPCNFTEAWRSKLQMTFAYDAVGNRTSWTRRDSSAAQLSWTATLEPSSNRYGSYGGWTLQYDSLGNLTRRTAGSTDIQYRWNSLGQLTGVYTAATGWVEYGYNGFGTRVRRTAGGVTTRFLYDGDDLAAELDASGNRIRSYTYYPGVDRPHTMRTWENGANGAVYYYALDLPGNNVAGMFDATGAVTHRYSYAPFGEALSATGTVTNPLRFAAREIDPTTGLYYVRARWYDATLGRFISEDPIGLAGGINNYAYALNDPVNLRDPSGLGPCPKEYYGCGTTVGLSPITVRGRAWGGSADVADYYDPNMRNDDGVNDLPHHLRYGTPELEGFKSSCDADFPTDKCSHVENSIESLVGHRLDICRWMGIRARQKFYTGNYHYDPNFAMYGWTDGRSVTLGPMSFAPIGSGHLAQFLQAQNTVAHEEAHDIWGPGHSDDNAGYIQSPFGSPKEIGEHCRAGRVFD